MADPVHARESLERLDINELDHMAFGCASGDVLSLKPSDVVIHYHGDLENPQHLFAQKGMAWARLVDLTSPIEVSVNDAGDFILEAGHHRWFAAQKTDRTILVHVSIKGKPIERILVKQEVGTAWRNRTSARRAGS